MARYNTANFHVYRAHFPLKNSYSWMCNFDLLVVYPNSHCFTLQDRSPDDTGVFDDAIWDSWEAAIHWANFLLPFAKFMGEEIALIDCLISLFMQVN